MAPAPKRQVDDVAIGNGLTMDRAFSILVEAVNDYAIFLMDTEGYVVAWTPVRSSTGGTRLTRSSASTFRSSTEKKT
jgi:hypothetical protein